MRSMNRFQVGGISLCVLGVLVYLLFPGGFTEQSVTQVDPAAEVATSMDFEGYASEGEEADMESATTFEDDPYFMDDGSDD